MPETNQQDDSRLPDNGVSSEELARIDPIDPGFVDAVEKLPEIEYGEPPMLTSHPSDKKPKNRFLVAMAIFLAVAMCFVIAGTFVLVHESRRLEAIEKEKRISEWRSQMRYLVEHEGWHWGPENLAYPPPPSP